MEKQTTTTATESSVPKAIVRRVVKEKLAEDMNLHGDALLAFSESARIFIHYLSATANDICKEAKRQTMSSDDVLSALHDIEFPEFVTPLHASLLEFRSKKTASKKRKLQPQPQLHESESETNADGDNDAAAAALGQQQA